VYNFSHKISYSQLSFYVQVSLQAKRLVPSCLSICGAVGNFSVDKALSKAVT